jgi:phenylalanyl-tRNA synthetase beta chain
MGHGASGSGEEIEVLVPVYRSDILHEVDLAEDVAIGHGFEKFGNELPKHSTFGEEEPLIRYSNAIRSVMVGLGYFEIVTLSLSSPKEQYASMNLDEEKSVIKVKNPVSEDHVLVRTSLLPSIIAILRKNKHRELPQRVFEVGDVVLERKNFTYLAGAAIHAKASFTEVKSLVQSVLASAGYAMEVTQGSHPGFLDGRCANVLVSGHRMGILGELSPAVIEAFELKYPVAAFELDLEHMFALHKTRGAH